jgi:hypothetical protein
LTIERPSGRFRQIDRLTKRRNIGRRGSFDEQPGHRRFKRRPDFVDLPRPIGRGRRHGKNATPPAHNQTFRFQGLECCAYTRPANTEALCHLALDQPCSRSEV